MRMIGANIPNFNIPNLNIPKSNMPNLNIPNSNIPNSWIERVDLLANPDAYDWYKIFLV